MTKRAVINNAYTHPTYPDVRAPMILDSRIDLQQIWEQSDHTIDHIKALLVRKHIDATTAFKLALYVRIVCIGLCSPAPLTLLPMRIQDRLAPDFPNRAPNPPLPHAKGSHQCPTNHAKPKTTTSTSS